MPSPLKKTAYALMALSWFIHIAVTTTKGAWLELAVGVFIPPVGVINGILITIGAF